MFEIFRYLDLKSCDFHYYNKIPVLLEKGEKELLEECKAIKHAVGAEKRRSITR
jgi:hypothetical protein